MVGEERCMCVCVCGGSSLISIGIEEPPEALVLKSTLESEVSRFPIVWEMEKGLKYPHSSHFTDG